MNLTDFHAKYFAHELTKRSPSASVEMLAFDDELKDAQIDLAKTFDGRFVAKAAAAGK